MNTYDAAIIIPARYGSTRFPGKPLAQLAGKAMLEHVFLNGCETKKELEDRARIFIGVATDDDRISTFCREREIPVCMTPSELACGTDRVQAALSEFRLSTEVIVGLQGDTPLLPATVITMVLEKMINNPSCQVGTPIVPLRWEDLDHLREVKKDSPFSGTTCVPHSETGQALWFSKNIIPAIRGEEKLREQSEFSPAYRHLGLYAYRKDALQRFTELPESHFEKIEGLEQLRMLENGISIQTVIVPHDSLPPLAGIDTEHDLARAEAYLLEKATS
jgi:3-deoxy-manno-octulosonate cytidylyltransferase (CMP-KDO synthetase)